MATATDDAKQLTEALSTDNTKKEGDSESEEDSKGSSKESQESEKIDLDPNAIDLQHDKEKSVFVFKSNNTDIYVLLILLFIGCVGIALPLFLLKTPWKYIIVIMVGYFGSTIMALSFNTEHFSFKFIVIILCCLYILYGAIIHLRMGIGISDVSGIIGIVNGLSTYTVVGVLFFYEFKLNKDAKSTLKYLFRVKKLILPVFAHFTDISTDIGVVVLYLERSHSSDYTHSDVNYAFLFVMSFIFLFFYRIVSGILIWYHTRSIIDGLLQFADVYILKTLSVQWKLGYTSTGRVLQFIQFLEAIFESVPQVILVLYVLIKDGFAMILCISLVLSFTSIMKRTLADDARFVAEEAKELELEKKKCSDIYCNYRFVVRVLWRLLDIILVLMILVMIWVVASALIVFICVSVAVVLMSIVIIVRYLNGDGFCYFMLNGVFFLPLIPWIERNVIWMLSLCIRYMYVCVMIVYGYAANDEMPMVVLIVLLVLIGVHLIVYVWMVGREGISIHTCVALEFNGKNWVRQDVSYRLSIVGCSNVEEIYALQTQGFDMKRCLGLAETWSQYPNILELVHLCEAWNYKQEGNYFESLAKNSKLEPLNDEDRKTVMEFLQPLGGVNADVSSAAQYHNDVVWIEAMVKYAQAKFDVAKASEIVILNKSQEAQQKIKAFCEQQK